MALIRPCRAVTSRTWQSNSSNSNHSDRQRQCEDGAPGYTISVPSKTVSSDKSDGRRSSSRGWWTSFSLSMPLERETQCTSVNSCLRLWYSPLMSACVDENANFAGFDLLDGDEDTLRLNSCVVRVYTKSHSSPNYSLLIEYDVALCCFQFIGKDVTSASHTSDRVNTNYLEIGSFHHPFPSNSVIVQLTDGYYTAFNDVVTHNHPPPIISDPTSKVSPTPRPAVNPVVTNNMLLLDTPQTRNP